MKPLEAGTLLTAWENGLNQPPLQRSLILLSAAFPGIEPERLLKLSLGQRDQYLLQLRENLFGQALLSTVVCPQCSERLEWENRVENFLVRSDQDLSIDREFELNTDAYSLRFRLPNSLDVETAIHSAGTGTAPHQLLSNCLLEAKCSGVSCDISQLPETILQRLEQEMESLDPLADLRIRLDCPECSHSWVVLFDIASFLWKEVNAWAQQMLQNIYRLAAAYGWSEQEILRISPLRRQLYLGMLG